LTIIVTEHTLSLIRTRVSEHFVSHWEIVTYVTKSVSSIGNISKFFGKVL